jgi:hypothetical protein
LDAEEHGSECEQKVVDMNFEQKINNIMHFLEVFNTDSFAKKYISLIQEEVVDPNCFSSGLNFDPSQDMQGVDYFMYSFENFHENELVDQPTEEQVDVSRFFLVDDNVDVYFFPRYDEYNDDYDIDFIEKLVACYPSGSVQFQQSHGITQPAYCIYDNGNEKNGDFADEKSLPLCFDSFELLKEKFKVITEEEEYDLMQSHIDSLE